MDPLLPETWYTADRQSIEQMKGGRTILEQYRGGLANTFITLFPDIGLDETKFEIRSTFSLFSPCKLTVSLDHFWQILKNRREWFDNFAKHKRFNPLIPANWYSAKVSDILAADVRN